MVSFIPVQVRSVVLMVDAGAICGDGMCPYIPCVNYPKCKHVEEIIGDDKNG